MQQQQQQQQASPGWAQVTWVTNEWETLAPGTHEAMMNLNCFNTGKASAHCLRELEGSEDFKSVIHAIRWKRFVIHEGHYIYFMSNIESKTWKF